MHRAITFLFVFKKYASNDPLPVRNGFFGKVVQFHGHYHPVSCSAEWSQGYDHASSCTRPYRAGRARAPPAPCDLSKHNYCSTPGTNYPWHAIRRFVRENQGLMKRMYGEERHIAVIKAELENFIEDDDDDDPKRPPIHDDDVIKTKLMYSKNNGRAMRVKPHFRPIQSTTNPTIDKNKTKYDNDTLKVKPIQEPTKTNKTEPNTKDNRTEISNETIEDNKSIVYKTKLESIANVEISSIDADVITLDAVIKQSIESNSILPSIPPGSLKSNKVEEPKNETIIEKNLTTTESLINATDQDIMVTETDVPLPITESSKDNNWKPMTHDTSTLPPTLLFSEHEKLKNDKVDNDKKDESQKPSHHQETVKPAVIKLRGANACESKEEMAAPFWANSTRGEVLALLNMYPFEQYIHLESCVHERKQMYCREGCRCEQQFRLHRLLAYDPRNECRGIFADWFKFPACCVCRCYDVPLEFRARSPRILKPQYDAEIKRAIYEDVARDWYVQTFDELDDFL